MFKIGDKVQYTQAFLHSIGEAHPRQGCDIRWAELRGIVAKIKTLGRGEFQIVVVDWEGNVPDDLPRKVHSKNLARVGDPVKTILTRTADGRIL